MADYIINDLRDERWFVQERTKAARDGDIRRLQNNGRYRSMADHIVCTEAARHSHLEFLQYARSGRNPYPWNTGTCAAAAENGHLHILQWLRAQKPCCDWNAFVCTNAADNGHLHIIQWARAQDPPCPWNSEVCAYAARNNHLHVIQWVRAQSPPCPLNISKCLPYGKSINLDIITWIICCDRDEQPVSVPYAHWYNQVVRPLHFLLVVEVLEDIHATNIHNNVVPKDVVRLVGEYANVSNLLFDKETKKAQVVAIKNVKCCILPHELLTWLN